MTITIQQAQEELTMEEWVFSSDNARLMLFCYTLQTKQSKRHKFITSELYHRTYPNKSTLKVEDVPLPEDIKRQALEAFVAKISVVK